MQSYIINRILAAILTTFYIFLFIFTLPVNFLIRLLVILLAKLLRPDLDNVLNSLSLMFFCDLATKTPSRANAIITITFKGQFSHEHAKSLVLKNWIEGRENKRKYKKFQQYPVTWMGFCFWKNAFDKFSIDNHVHKYSGTDKIVREDQVTSIIEELLNTELPKNQSPWEFYVIEKYALIKEGQDSETKDCTGSVLMFKLHHTLADGFSVLSAVVDGLFKNQSITEINLPQSSFSEEKTEKSLCEKIQWYLMFPINSFIEGWAYFTNNIREQPWGVPDDKKKWHQFVIRAEPIPIQTIKDIKNEFGVGFTSVLLSTVSAAIYQNSHVIKNINSNYLESPDSFLCMSVLPSLRRRRKEETITNEFASAILDIPSTHYDTPLERLCEVDRILIDRRKSLFPYYSQIIPKAIASYIFPISRLIFKDIRVPVVLTNLPGLSHQIEVNGNTIIDNGVQLGYTQGITGIMISVLSYNQKLRIAVAVEEGLMSREEGQQFVKSMVDEIHLLNEIRLKLSIEKM